MLLFRYSGVDAFRRRLRWAAWVLALAVSLIAGQRPTISSSFANLAAAADAARDANQLPQAAELYRKALLLRPDWAQGWWYLGTIRYDQNSYREAADAFQHLLALHPRTGSAQAMLGLCQDEIGDEREALHNIQEALRRGLPDDPQMKQVLLFHQGMLLRHLGRLEEAQDAFATLCAEQVHSPSLNRELGLAELRMRGPVPTAPADAAQVIPALGWAGCLADQSKFDQARQAFAEVTRRNPRFPHIHDAYGLFLLKLHEPDKAIAEFKQEIQGAPGEVFARLEIAAADYRVDSAAGLPWAEEAVRLDPRQPLGHYFLGLLRADTGDFRRAIPELEQARRALPEDSKLWFALGSSYAHLGEKQKAAQAWATFQQLRRRDAAASTNSVYGQGPISPALPEAKIPADETKPHE